MAGVGIAQTMAQDEGTKTVDRPPHVGGASGQRDTDRRRKSQHARRAESSCRSGRPVSDGGITRRRPSPRNSSKAEVVAALSSGITRTGTTVATSLAPDRRTVGSHAIP